ncbi:MAG TPA: NADH-dependent [FeFe] hydrogenase, group A6 [Acidobacteriota bacterium]|nr:NADH-dependent [FeFe] hydrogenase, group A6 [Acidobacteriota bacterium]
MNTPAIEDIRVNTEAERVNLTIDGQPLSVPKGSTILEAAEEFGIRIPRLCYHPQLSLAGSCRVCIVDVKGMGHYLTACSNKVWEGMAIETNSPEIRQARRDIVELLLDNHVKDCQTCERDGDCELQTLAQQLGVRERLFEGERKNLAGDYEGIVVREPNKCILCGRCFRVCAEVQGVCNLSQHGRGFTTVVAPAHGSSMDRSVCIQCGQCINVCPTAAFLEKDSTDDVWTALADPKKYVVVQTAPSIRATIGECFGLRPGVAATNKMIASLRRLGFDAVFDTNFAADLTVVEESHEFLERLAGRGGPLPMITSCSSGWVSFLEKFYPRFIPHMSGCRSPMSMLSSLVKTYYAGKIGRDPADIYMVAVMPCVAKKHEAALPKLSLRDGIPMTDAVLTTREAAWMIKSYGIDYWNLPNLEFWSLPKDTFDTPLGVASGAGDIFGTTGGVMEAALRTAVEKLSGKPLEKIDFTEVRGVSGLTEASIRAGGMTLRVAVANTLRHAAEVLEKVSRGEEYHLIEIMACPGGCIGGGGQPYPPKSMRVMDPDLLAMRSSALLGIDRGKALRRSHENPAIRQLYEEFLGHAGSELAHRLLHTHYEPRLPYGIPFRNQKI